MQIPETAAKLFRAVAPVLGTALGGPLGLSVATVASKLLDQFVEPSERGLPMTPQRLVEVVDQNANDPQLALNLRRAELAVKDYELRMKEIDSKFDLLKLEAQDRADARAAAKDSGAADGLRRRGFGLVYFGMALLFATVAGSLVLISGVVQIPSDAAGVVAGLFSLIGVAIGYVNGWASQVVNFYYGSSQGSKDKTDSLNTAMQDLGSALGEAAAARPPPPAPPAPPPSVVVLPQPVPGPSPSAPVPDSEWKQGPFGGIRWRLTPGGVVLEGKSEPLRTVGQPATARRIWADYGKLIASSCAQHGVPLELVVATIATESRGVLKAKLVEPDARMSIGLMQPLVGTAEMVLGRSVTPDELYEPALNIEVGTRYIASQRKTTDFQPPLVAAAYNAGSLGRARPQDDNPWNLRSTGDHIHRLCQYYGDSCAVAAEDRWQQGASSQIGG